MDSFVRQDFLFIMGPHPKNFHSPDVLQDLIDKTVLYVDPSGIGATEFPDQFLIGRRSLEWALGKHEKQLFCFWPEARSRKLLGVLPGLRRENYGPAHHPGSWLHFETGIFIPLIIEAFMPGIAERKIVSCMARQSSSEIKIALVLFPVICTGSCE
jgi:hypothetical protein